jgi:hypothetical protein
MQIYTAGCPPCLHLHAVVFTLPSMLSQPNSCHLPPVTCWSNTCRLPPQACLERTWCHLYVVIYALSSIPHHMQSTAGCRLRGAWSAPSAHLCGPALPPHRAHLCVRRRTGGGCHLCPPYVLGRVFDAKLVCWTLHPVDAKLVCWTLHPVDAKLVCWTLHPVDTEGAAPRYGTTGACLPALLTYEALSRIARKKSLAGLL